MACMHDRKLILVVGIIISRSHFGPSAVPPQTPSTAHLVWGRADPPRDPWGWAFRGARSGVR